MKLNKWFVVAGIATLALTASCSSDNDDTDKEVTGLYNEVNFPAITLDQEEFDVVVYSSRTVNITEGGGNYRVISSKPSIVSATIEGNAIALEGKDYGEASVIITDGNNQAIHLSVFSHYEAMKLSEEVVDAQIKLGNTGKFTMQVLEGNPGYTVASDNSDIADATISGNDITISLKKEGTANLTVTDAFGLEQSVVVNVTSTVIPYTEEELTAIKDDDTQRTYYLGEERQQRGSWKYSIEEDRYTCGWDYWGYYFFLVSFDGDNTVGVKTNGAFKAKFGWYDPEITATPEVEIIKNDGDHLWGTFSWIEEEVLKFGYFCMDIAD